MVVDTSTNAGGVMSIGALRGTVVALASAVIILALPLAAEPVALGSYNAVIGASS